MTNEELAAEVQAGRAGYGELWEQVRRFIGQQAFRWFTLYGDMCKRAGVELDDLMQCGFLALQDAVKAFDPARGYSLLTYLGRHLQKRFREACGIRTSKRDPLNDCTSLNKPVGEEKDGASLGDFLPDSGAAAAMESVEERLYSQELHNAMAAALDTLEERQRDTIRRRFWERDTLEDIAMDTGVSRERVRQTEAAALRALRRGQCRKLLEPFHEQIVSHFAWRGTGFRHWKNTGVSSVERAAEKTEGVMQRLYRQRDQDRASICALLHITPEEYERMYLDFGKREAAANGGN